jgi:hypothetical protein
MKTLILAAWLAVCALFSGTAHAAEPPARTYAVLSLLGDTLQVVHYQMGTGSHINRAGRQTLDVKNGWFDTVAVSAVESTLVAAPANAKVQLFAVDTPALFERERQDRLFDGNRVVLPAPLLSAVRADGATHLVLLTKQRSEARLALRSGTIGTAMLEGLGFYVDPTVPLESTTTLREAQGFLAPFAHIRITLVDLVDGRVLAHKPVTASTLIAVADNPNVRNPWELLSAEEKIATLRSLLERELREAVPALIASR